MAVAPTRFDPGFRIDYLSVDPADCRKIQRANRTRWTGFTLVEMLVVLLVVGIGLGLVTLSAGHDEAALLRQESERLRSALEHAAQLAQWRHVPLAWEADANGYRFASPARDGTWTDETDPTLAPHPLPPNVRMRVTDASGVVAPLHLLMRPSGRNDPYAIAIESPSGAWTIAGDPLNRVRAARSR